MNLKTTINGFLCLFRNLRGVDIISLNYLYSEPDSVCVPPTGLHDRVTEIIRNNLLIMIY